MKSLLHIGTQKIGLAHTHPDTHIGRAFTEITEPLAVTKHLADLWISKASMMGLQPTPDTHVMWDPRKKKLADHLEISPIKTRSQ